MRICNAQLPRIDCAAAIFAAFNSEIIAEYWLATASCQGARLKWAWRPNLVDLALRQPPNSIGIIFNEQTDRNSKSLKAAHRAFALVQSLR
jgi:hypothetical protein